MQQPVMRVKPWGQGQGDFVEINVEDFNPDLHTPLEAAEKPAKGPDGNGDGKVTAAELREALAAKGIAFKSSASKPELQALLEAAEKPAE